MADKLPMVDEFVFVLLAGLLLIFIPAFSWVAPAEGAPVVEESSFSVKAYPGEATKLSFDVIARTDLSSINLSATGDIEDWVTFNRNNFDISKGDKVTITADIEPGSDQEFGIYNGHIRLNGPGGEDSFSVSVEIVEEDEMITTTRKIPSSEFPSKFSVRYARGTELLDSKSNFRVSSGYFSSKSATLTGLITDDKMNITTGASVQIDVADTNGLGSLEVYINDQKIYGKTVGIGEIFIPIQKDIIERANILEIKSDKPGFVIWGSSFYDISEAKLNLDYEGTFEKRFNITLNENEVENFKSLNLYGRVEDYSAPIPPMMIKVNDQIVYWNEPPLAAIDTSLDEDMFGNPLYLNDGENEVTFMFERNAQYDLTEAMLVVEYYQ